MHYTTRTLKALAGASEVEISLDRCCQAVRWAVRIRLGDKPVMN